jgi:hypothetical protein
MQGTAAHLVAILERTSTLPDARQPSVQDVATFLDALAFDWLVRAAPTSLAEGAGAGPRDCPANV